MKKYKNLIGIVAASLNGCIGDKKNIPWKIKQDLYFFKSMTINNTVIMGSNTYFPLKDKLKERDLICFGSKGVSMEDILLEIEQNPQKLYFVAGGSITYSAFEDYINTWYYTQVHTEICGDTYYKTINEIKGDKTPIFVGVPFEGNQYPFIIYKIDTNE
jgi:dihydrofolate reductase